MEHDSDLNFESLLEQTEESEAYGPWLVAAYIGTCPGCGDQIDEGDEIRYAEASGGFEGRCCDG